MLKIYLILKAKMAVWKIQFMVLKMKQKALTGKSTWWQTLLHAAWAVPALPTLGGVLKINVSIDRFPRWPH